MIFIVIGICFSSRPMRREESYIDQFKYLAVSEMQRTGIPASIKLAQGLMESASGRSELAVNANNHFGIKCKSDWNGETYSYKDDDFANNGELLFSCFRKYSSPEYSYLDHSNFLKNRSRYKALFEFSITDYKSWARGLKNCGYATDPTYAEKIIETIEKYDLNNLDTNQPDTLAELKASPIEALEKPMEIKLSVQAENQTLNVQSKQLTQKGSVKLKSKPLKSKNNRVRQAKTCKKY